MCLIVHIVIFHLCKVFISLWSCFVRLVVVLETIKVNFHSSTLCHFINLQQWPIYSSMLSLSSVSDTKVQLFHENYLFSPCKHICLHICNLIIYSCVAMHKWTNRWRSCDHTSINVFLHYQSFLFPPCILICDNWRVYTFCTYYQHMHIQLQKHSHLTVLSWLHLYIWYICILHNDAKSIWSHHYVMLVKLYNHMPHVYYFVYLLVALWTIFSLMPTTIQS